VPRSRVHGALSRELINSPGKPDGRVCFVPESDKSLHCSEMGHAWTARTRQVAPARSIAPKSFRQFGVAHGVLNILMPEIGAQRTGVVPRGARISRSTPTSNLARSARVVGAEANSWGASASNKNSYDKLSANGGRGSGGLINGPGHDAFALATIKLTQTVSPRNIVWQQLRSST
jgi:hypothetical protein